MELLYVWIEEYNNIRKQGFNLSSRFNFKYDYQSGLFTIRERDNHIENLFHRSEWKDEENVVRQVTAIVGENGSGKTSFFEFVNEHVISAGYSEKRFIVAFSCYDSTIQITSSEGLVKEVKPLTDHLYKRFEHPLPSTMTEDEKKVFEEHGYDSLSDIHSLSFAVKVLKHKISERRGVDLLDNHMHGTIFHFELYDLLTPQFDLRGKDIKYLISKGLFGEFTGEVKVSEYFEVINHIRYYNISPIIGEMTGLPLPFDLNPFIRMYPTRKEKGIDYFVQNQLAEFFDHLCETTYQKKKCEQIIQAILELVSRIEENEKIDDLSDRKRVELIWLKHLIVHLFWEMGLIIHEIPFFKINLDEIINNELRKHVESSINELIISILMQMIAVIPKIDFKHRFREDIKEGFFIHLNTLVKFITSIGLFLQKTNLYGTHSDDKNFLIVFDKINDRDRGYSEFFQQYFKSFFLYSYMQFDWGNLSSGERIFLNLFIDITKKLISQSKESENLILLMDECDLGFHPKWQKEFLKRVLTFISKIASKFGIESVQIIISSNSPFVISDLPKGNIVFLKKDEKYGFCEVVNQLSDMKKTFGANIHTLLSDSFFMKDGLIGEFAATVIDDVISYLNSGPNSRISTDEEAQKYIDILGEPILQTHLQKMLKKNQFEKIQSLEEENQKLRMQIKNFKNNDKN